MQSKFKPLTSILLAAFKFGRLSGKVLLHSVSTIAVAIIATTLIVEVGGWLRRTTLSRIETHKSPHQVVLVGDSILGIETNPQSLSHHFISSMQRQLGSEVASITYSIGALVVAEAHHKIKILFNDRVPDAVILMVGKSDRNATLFGAPNWPRWTLDLQFPRLLAALASDMSFRIQAIHLRLRTGADFTEAWRLYSDKNYSEAIPLFEKELLLTPNYRRPLRPLYHCYLEEKRFLEGAQYFQKLASRSRHAKLIQTFAANLQIEYNQINNIPTSAKAATTIEWLKHAKGRREAFKVLLRIYQSTGQRKEFASLLENMTADESFTFPTSEVQILKNIVNDCSAAGTTLILLQYPTDNADSLRKTVGPLPPNVVIVDTRLWLLSGAQRDQLVHLIKDDMEHLTAEGAKIIGYRLADLVSELLQKKIASANRPALSPQDSHQSLQTK